MNAQPASSPALSSQLPGQSGVPAVAPSYPTTGSVAQPAEISDDIKNLAPGISDTLNYSVASPATAAIMNREYIKFAPANPSEGGFVSGSTARFELASSGYEVINGPGSWFDITVSNADSTRGSSLGMYQTANANGIQDHIATVTISAGANKTVLTKIEKYNLIAHMCRMFQTKGHNSKDYNLRAFEDLDGSTRETGTIHMPVPIETQKQASYVPTLYDNGSTDTRQPGVGMVGDYRSQINQNYSFRLRACNFLMNTVYIPLFAFGSLIIEITFADGREAIDANISHTALRYGVNQANIKNMGLTADRHGSLREQTANPSTAIFDGCTGSGNIIGGLVQNAAQVPPRFRYTNFFFVADVLKLSAGMVKAINAAKNSAFGLPYVWNDYKYAETTLTSQDMSRKQFIIWGSAANIIRAMMFFNPRGVRDHQYGHGYTWASYLEKVVGIQFALGSYRWPKESRQSVEEMYEQMKAAMDLNSQVGKKLIPFEYYALLDHQGNPITRKGNPMDPSSMSLYNVVNDMGTTDIYAPATVENVSAGAGATIGSNGTSMVLTSGVNAFPPTDPDVASLAVGAGFSGRLTATNIVHQAGFMPRLALPFRGITAGSRVRFGAAGEWTQWFNTYSSDSTIQGGAKFVRLEGTRTKDVEGAISKVSFAISNLQLFRRNGISISIGSTPYSPIDPDLDGWAGSNQAGDFGFGVAPGSDYAKAHYDVTGCNPAFVSDAAAAPAGSSTGTTGSLTATISDTEKDIIIAPSDQTKGGHILFKPVRVYYTNGALRCQAGYSCFGSPALWLNDKLGFYFPMYAQRGNLPSMAATGQTLSVGTPAANVWHPTGMFSQVSCASVIEGPIQIETIGVAYANPFIINVTAGTNATSVSATATRFDVYGTARLSEATETAFAGACGAVSRYGTFCVNIGVPGHHPVGYNEKIESAADAASAGFVRAAPYVPQFVFAQKFKLHDKEVLSGISTLGSNALTGTIQLWASVTREYYVCTVIEYTKMAMIGAQGNTLMAE